MFWLTAQNMKKKIIKATIVIVAARESVAFQMTWTYGSPVGEAISALILPRTAMNATVIKKPRV